LAVGVSGSMAARFSTSAAPKGYTGVEATLPIAYKRPAKRPGTKCTIGFQNPVAANETLSYLQKAVVKQGAAYGCKVITLDDELSADKQVSNMQQLLAQKVNTIIFYPLDPKAVQPVLRQAKSQGVPVLAIDATFGNPKAPAPNITTQVWQGRDIQAYLQAGAMKVTNKGGQIGLIGIGFPVPALKYLTSRESFYAKKNGLSVVGTQDNLRRRDRWREGRERPAPALSRHERCDRLQRPERAQPPRLHGCREGAVIVGLNGSSDGLAAVKGGRIAATVGSIGRLGQPAGACLLQPDHEAEPASAEGDRASGDADHESERRQRSSWSAGQGHC
jgi:ribose transport system substrate-binding protein